jgi:hypothetical protein
MRNERVGWVLAACLLAVAAGVACSAPAKPGLNPRPEDFPSVQPPGEMNNSTGEDIGNGEDPGDVPDPVGPSTGEPPNETPGNIPGVADAGVVPADAMAPDADPGADTN